MLQHLCCILPPASLRISSSIYPATYFKTPLQQQNLLEQKYAGYIRPQPLDTVFACGSWSSSGMSTSKGLPTATRTWPASFSPPGYACFRFMHHHTLPRVVDFGKTAFVSALVTATVLFKLTSLLRLSGPDENYRTILTAIKPLKVVKYPRPLPSCIPRRLE